MKLAKHKIWAIVVSSVLAVALITGGIFILRPYLGAYNTTDETSVTGYIGNLLNADKSLNTTTYNTLLDKIGGGVGAVTGVKNSQQLSSSPIIFQMGTHPTTSKAIYWQVVYRTGDYITIMMTQPYTTGQFNPSSADGNYLYNGNYSSSYLRRDTLAIYDTLSSNFPILSDVIVSPSTMESATGTTWQSVQNRTEYYTTSSGTHRYSIINGLGGYSTTDSTNNPYGWSVSSCMSDKFWIPSFYEIDNADTSYTGSNSSYVGDSDNRKGLWALSNTEQGFNSASGGVIGGDSTSYCWLRSGDSGMGDRALIVDHSGLSRSSLVDGTRGVRPAAHLSLSMLASKAGYSVTASVAGGASSDSETEISPAADGGSIYAPNSSVTVKFKIKNTHYEIASITKNGSDIKSQFTQSGDTYSYTFTVTENTAFLCTIQPKKYTLTTAVANSVGGSLKITSPQSDSTTSTASYQISYGASVTLTATASTGYKFTKWQKDSVDVETSTTYTFTMGESCNVTAYFTILSYNITIQAGTGGSVSPSGTQSWQYNSKHTITATPSTHYNFVNWTNSSGTAVSTSASYTVTVGASDQTYTANFAIKQYSIKISSNDTNMGSIVIVENNLLTDKTSLNTTANALTKYTALAITNDEYIFTGWQDASGSIVTTSNRLEVTLTNNSQYTAIFVESTVDGIFVTSTYGGMAYILGDNFETLADTDLVVINTRIAVSGYRIVRWIDQDGNVLDDGNADLTSLVMTKAQLYNKLITAVFEYQGSGVKDETGN